MKPKPFASLNHFTVPWTTGQLSLPYLPGRSPGVDAASTRRLRPATMAGVFGARQRPNKNRQDTGGIELWFAHPPATETHALDARWGRGDSDLFAGPDHAVRCRAWSRCRARSRCGIV